MASSKEENTGATAEATTKMDELSSDNPKKRPADATTTASEEAEKLAARREANRIHALKSRQRSKALLVELQRTVNQLSGEKAEMERENAVLRAQVEVLQQQNMALTQSQRMLLIRAGHFNQQQQQQQGGGQQQGQQQQGNTVGADNNNAGGNTNGNANSHNNNNNMGFVPGAAFMSQPQGDSKGDEGSQQLQQQQPNMSMMGMPGMMGMPPNMQAFMAQQQQQQPQQPQTPIDGQVNTATTTTNTSTHHQQGEVV